MISSSNPTLSTKVFTQAGRASSSSEAMTISGTANKTMILLGLVFLTALWSWGQVMQSIPAYQGAPVLGPSPIQGPLFIGSLIGGFILAMVTIFVKKCAPYTAPLYALAEGVVLGTLSAFFETMYPGIVFQAVVATFGTLFGMLFMYKNQTIRATPGFKKGMSAALLGIFFVYLVGFIMSFFGKTIPYIHESGPIGIAFSVFVVGVAAFTLILDFDRIEQGERLQAPKFMEWYSAFGLLVTLVWLYLEILQLLAKLRRRD